MFVIVYCVNYVLICTLINPNPNTTYTIYTQQGFHDKRSQQGAKEEHSPGGDSIKALIFGGLDGILTSFAIVAGAAGGGMSVSVVLVLGFSNILADALSMGVGEFLSSKAHNEWVLSERLREKWELENYPEGEIQEIPLINYRPTYTLLFLHLIIPYNTL